MRQVDGEERRKGRQKIRRNVCVKSKGGIREWSVTGRKWEERTGVSQREMRKGEKSKKECVCREE